MEEEETLALVDSWPSTLQSLGLNISKGGCFGGKEISLYFARNADVSVRLTIFSQERSIP